MSIFNIMSVSAGVPLSQVKPSPSPETGKDGTQLDLLNKSTGRTVTATASYLTNGMHLLK